MGIGFAGLIVMVILTAVKYGNADTSDIPSIMFILMWAFGGIAVAIPLVIGAIIGGLAIHRYGWVPLTVLIAGLMCVGLGQLDGLRFLLPYSYAAVVIGVIGIFLLAIFRSKVDIWLQLPMFGSPRAYLRRDKYDKKK